LSGPLAVPQADGPAKAAPGTPPGISMCGVDHGGRRMPPGAPTRDLPGIRQGTVPLISRGLQPGIQPRSAARACPARRSAAPRAAAVYLLEQAA